MKFVAAECRNQHATGVRSPGGVAVEQYDSPIFSRLDRRHPRDLDDRVRTRADAHPNSISVTAPTGPKHLAPGPNRYPAP